LATLLVAFAKKGWAVMKTRTVVLLLATLSCLLLVVAPAMAGPILFNPPSGDSSTTDLSGEFGIPAPDYLSTLHTAAPDGLDPSSPAGPYKIIGGGPNDPPIPVPTSEPSGITVILGSALFGVLGLWRRNLKDLI